MSGMLFISEILIQEHELASFVDLLEKVQTRAREGARFLQMDVKPPFPDTPEDWESRLEAAFTARGGI